MPTNATFAREAVSMDHRCFLVDHSRFDMICGATSVRCTDCKAAFAHALAEAAWLEANAPEELQTLEEMKREVEGEEQ